MITSWSLLLLFSLALSQPQQDCPCEKFVFTGDIPTSHMVTTIVERKPIRRLQGKVVNINGEPPVEKAYVFVSRVMKDIPGRDRFAGKDYDKRHLIACETLRDGKFCFRNIRPGKYEVCATSPGYNNTCVLVTVSRRGRRNVLDIELQAGT